jgi:hypothetical protein
MKFNSWPDGPGRLLCRASGDRDHDDRRSRDERFWRWRPSEARTGGLAPTTDERDERRDAERV